MGRSGAGAGWAGRQDVLKLSVCPSGFPWFSLGFPPFTFTVSKADGPDGSEREVVQLMSHTRDRPTPSLLERNHFL